MPDRLAKINTDAATIAELTQANAHPEAIEYLFRHVLRDMAGAKAAQGIVHLCAYYGHSGPELSAVQYDLYQSALARAKYHLTPHEYDKIHAAF